MEVSHPLIFSLPAVMSGNVRYFFTGSREDLWFKCWSWMRVWYELYFCFAHLSPQTCGPHRVTHAFAFCQSHHDTKTAIMRQHQISMSSVPFVASVSGISVEGCFHDFSLLVSSGLICQQFQLKHMLDAFDFGFYHLVWHTCVKSLWFVHSWLFVRVDIARFKTASIVLIILIKTIFFFFDFQLKEVLRLHWGRV